MKNVLIKLYDNGGSFRLISPFDGILTSVSVGNLEERRRRNEKMKRRGVSKEGAAAITNPIGRVNG